MKALRIIDGLGASVCAGMADELNKRRKAEMEIIELKAREEKNEIARFRAAGFVPTHNGDGMQIVAGRILAGGQVQVTNHSGKYTPCDRNRTDHMSYHSRRRYLAEHLLAMAAELGGEK